MARNESPDVSVVLLNGHRDLLSILESVIRHGVADGQPLRASLPTVFQLLGTRNELTPPKTKLSSFLFSR